MAKEQKLFDKVLKLNKGMRFDEIVKVLSIIGYTKSAPGGGSSHHTFRKPGCRALTIP